MTPLRYPAFQIVLIEMLSIAGILSAVIVARYFGVNGNGPFLVGSFAVTCFAYFELYRLRRAPLFFRGFIRFIAYFSVTTFMLQVFALTLG